MAVAKRVTVFPVEGIPEVRPGDDLAPAILAALGRGGERLRDHDAVVVAQKVVSKSEGRLVRLDDVVPSPDAKRIGAEYEKDPRAIELILRESSRIVRMSRGVIICETRHGFVCANAGIDRSNAGAPDTVVLLPEDPDGSARRLRGDLRRHTGADVAVVITDTFGRAWREGQVNVAIGSSGLPAFVRYIGQRDPDGYELRVTEVALADEIAAASELVMGKLARRPVAIVRGLEYESVDEPARDYVRPVERDLFR